MSGCAPHHHHQIPGRQDRRGDRAQGKIINQIQEETGADITIGDDGTIYVGASEGSAAEEAGARSTPSPIPAMPEPGERYLGTVVKTTNFGAFISLMPGKDGLLHISEVRKLVGGKRIDAVEDVLLRWARRSGGDQGGRPARKLSLIPVLDDEGDSDGSEPDEA